MADGDYPTNAESQPKTRMISRRKALAAGAAAISALGIGAQLTAAAPVTPAVVEPTISTVITGSGVILRHQSQVWVNQPGITEGSTVLVTLLGDTGAFVGPMLSVSIVPGHGFNVDLGVSAGRTTSFNYLIILPGGTIAVGGAGPAGVTGATGATGPAGVIGFTGMIGGTGSGGDAGPTGMMGANGADGAIGDVGPVGPTGPIGSLPPV